MKTRWISIGLVLAGILVLGLAMTGSARAAVTLTPTESLGKALFFDANLSLNNNQSCASCHAKSVGYVGPDKAINKAGGVYEGSIPGAFGDRKPPSAAYAGDSPILYFDGEAWVGGMFWDGRAAGWDLGDPLAEQAKGPFLNPKEQAVPNAATMIAKVQASSYAAQFASVCPGTDTSELYNCIGRAIAAYERSYEVSAYTSKFDKFWMKAGGKGLSVADINMKNWNKYKNLGLETDELKGLALFNTKGQCSACHTLDAGPAGYPLFTDFTYDNLGIPKNPLNPATIADPTWADPGLGKFLMMAGFPEDVYAAEMGKFKVPTLRNVDLRPNNKVVKAYGHNAYFKSLKEIVHFYNTRDVAMWPAPETPENINTTELGNLGLTAHEEDLIVGFLKTLSDGWKK
jgi:cytochrome c peroxidase